MCIVCAVTSERTWQICCTYLRLVPGAPCGAPWSSNAAPAVWLVGHEVGVCACECMCVYVWVCVCSVLFTRVKANYSPGHCIIYEGMWLLLSWTLLCQWRARGKGSGSRLKPHPWDSPQGDLARQKHRSAKVRYLPPPPSQGPGVGPRCALQSPDRLQASARPSPRRPPPPPGAGAYSTRPKQRALSRTLFPCAHSLPWTPVYHLRGRSMCVGGMGELASRLIQH